VSIPAFISIDHGAHFVPDISAASAALTELGFTLTPLSAQSHRVTPDAPLTPAGASNRCVMLGAGYLEFLTPTLDTPNARQLREAIARYTGVHLIAFGTHDARADHARLEREGFQPLTPLSLQRTVGTPDGEATARFTVVRVPPGTMAEGRIQYCQHHTPEVVWQPRWTVHTNAVAALAGVLLCVADAEAAARRYERFTGIESRRSGDTWRMTTSRGELVFASPDAFQCALGVRAPALPWIAGYVIDSHDMHTTRARIHGATLGERLCARLPPALGGVMIFQPAGAGAEPLAL
jgi:hypothetical protein